MKKFRFWLFLTAIIFSFSCSKDPGVETPDPETPDASGHKVEVSAALSELQSVLSGIDGETRSGSGRRVGSVLSVKGSDVLPETRSGEDLNVEDLVYIANFENGEGYAVLGADDRLASVIAITDQGSLTAEEFAAAARGEYDDVDAPPVWPAVAAYVSGFGGIDTGGGGIGPIIPTIHDYGPWKPWERVWPLVDIKWGQGRPYNYYTPKVNGTKSVVGCVAVALGQIITSNWHRVKVNYGEYIGGYAIDWNPIFSIINKIRANPDKPRFAGGLPSSNFDLNMAKLLHGIGTCVNMNYGEKSSSAYDADARSFLESVGYRNVQLIRFTEAQMLSMLRELRPFYVSGQPSINESGHAWVIDGLYRQHREVNVLTGPQAPSSYTEYRTLVHCNFGYDGESDGYYNIVSFFDLTKEPVLMEPGDRKPQNPMTGVFSSNLQMITYSGF